MSELPGGTSSGWRDGDALEAREAAGDRWEFGARAAAATAVVVVVVDGPRHGLPRRSTEMAEELKSWWFWSIWRIWSCGRRPTRSLFGAAREGLFVDESVAEDADVCGCVDDEDDEIPGGPKPSFFSRAARPGASEGFRVSCVVFLLPLLPPKDDALREPVEADLLSPLLVAAVVLVVLVVNHDELDASKRPADAGGAGSEEFVGAAVEVVDSVSVVADRNFATMDDGPDDDDDDDEDKEDEKLDAGVVLSNFFFPPAAARGGCLLWSMDGGGRWCRRVRSSRTSLKVRMTAGSSAARRVKTPASSYSPSGRGCVPGIALAAPVSDDTTPPPPRL